MKFNIIVTDTFKKDYKRLSYKYPSLKSDIIKIVESLENKPNQGTPLGKDCFKIRLAIQSKGKGKSGGGRLITCVKIIQETVFLLCLFDKSSKESIFDKELDFLLKQAGLSD